MLRFQISFQIEYRLAVSLQASPNTLQRRHSTVPTIDASFIPWHRPGGDVADTIHAAVSPRALETSTRVDKRQTKEHFSPSYHPSNSGPSLENKSGEVSIGRKYGISSAHPASLQRRRIVTWSIATILFRGISFDSRLRPIVLGDESVTFNPFYRVTPN